MEWEVQKGKPQCDGCQGEFLDQQSTHCLLMLGGETLARQDYCSNCWTDKIVPGLVGVKDYATWAGRYKVILPIPKEEVIRKDHAQALFAKLLASGDPSKKNILFVMAVMLERKKILKQQKIVRQESVEGSPGKKMLVYVHGETGESITIEDPQIPLMHWTRIQKEVTDLLAEELALSSSPG